MCKLAISIPSKLETLSWSSCKPQSNTVAGMKSAIIIIMTICKLTAMTHTRIALSQSSFPETCASSHQHEKQHSKWSIQLAAHFNWKDIQKDARIHQCVQSERYDKDTGYTYHTQLLNMNNGMFGKTFTQSQGQPLKAPSSPCSGALCAASPASPVASCAHEYTTLEKWEVNNKSSLQRSVSCFESGTYF